MTLLLKTQHFTTHGDGSVGREVHIGRQGQGVQHNSDSFFEVGHIATRIQPKMKTAITMVALVALLSVSPTTAAVTVDSAVLKEFSQFKQKFGKRYNSIAEEMKRMRIFEENMYASQLLNSMNPHAEYGVNQFSDLAREEFVSMYANSAEYYAQAPRSNERALLRSSPFKLSRPSTIDWREKGAVTPVKDQGECGSCWAFSAIGNIEGQWFLGGQSLVNLSEQHLVSCDKDDSACDGGLMESAFRWIIRKHKGTVFSEESYPYTSGDGTVPQCNENDHDVAAKIRDYGFIASNEDKMANWLAENGPIAIAVDATTFQSYKGGIVTDCVAKKINHGVLLVGYDETSNPPYWIIKNSWSAKWGEKGYIRIRKGTNECLVKDYPISSVASKSL